MKLVAASALALMAAAPVAGADIIDITSYSPGSTENLGTFSGTISYSAQSATLGELTVSLTNTSPPANDGLITGFVFQIESADADAAAALTAASHPFTALAGENAAPFGTFDAGAALGGSWLGGGSPNGGIAVGQTGTFTFDITASDAGSLSAASFITEGEPYGFLARFRGFADGGSDKVPGVPAPGAAGVLAGAGLLALRRRR